MTRQFDRETERALLIADYQNTRVESGRAQDAQQNTLTWSMAGLGALFGGAILAATPVLVTAKPQPLAVIIYGLIFGLVAPAFGFVSGFAYFGQVRRAERAGAYLRGREDHFASLSHPGDAPVLWETFLSSGLPEARQILSPQLSAAMLYCGSMLVSALAFLAGEGLYAPVWEAVGRSVGIPGDGPWASITSWATVVAVLIGSIVGWRFLALEAGKVRAMAPTRTDHTALNGLLGPSVDE